MAIDEQRAQRQAAADAVEKYTKSMSFEDGLACAEALRPFVGPLIADRLAVAVKGARRGGSRDAQKELAEAFISARNALDLARQTTIEEQFPDNVKIAVSCAMCGAPMTLQFVYWAPETSKLRDRVQVWPCATCGAEGSGKFPGLLADKWPGHAAKN